MEIRYTSIQRKPSHEALPSGKIRIYYNEIESTETASHRDEESGEETEETYPVYLYRVADADSLTRDAIIVALIRAEYSADDELAIQRQKDEKPLEYSEYSAYVEWCKAYSLRVLHGDTLDTAKAIKVAESGQYDASPEVNTFYIGNAATWLSPAARSNYLLTIQAAQAAGVETVIFEGVTLPVADALAALNAINIYAMQCVGVTEAHKANILALESVADVERYDFTVGYPEKLHF